MTLREITDRKLERRYWRCVLAVWDAHPEYDLGEIERAFKARFTWEERQAMLILSPDEIEYMLTEKWPSLARQ